MIDVETHSGEAALAYAAQCAAIHRAAFQVVGARSWSPYEIEDLLKRPGAMLITADGGFLLADVIGDEAEILSIAVSPEQQGKGFGSALMAELFTTLTYRKVRSCVLEVALGNNAAISLYRRCGFIQIGLRAGYFRYDSGRVDALIMQKVLS